MRPQVFNVSVFAAGLIVTSAVLAQADFQSRIDLVAVDVCVKRTDGSSETELKPEDFLLLENDVPQKISLFSAEGHVPLAVSILVDSSESMSGPPLRRAQAAAGALIDLLRPDDLVEVMSFNDRASLRYPLGPDHARAKSTLELISAGGETALYDAVVVAVHNQEHAQHKRTADYREVMVLLSEGENTAGHRRGDPSSVSPGIRAVPAGAGRQLAPDHGPRPGERCGRQSAVRLLRTGGIRLGIISDDKRRNFQFPTPKSPWELEIGRTVEVDLSGPPGVQNSSLSPSCAVRGASATIALRKLTELRAPVGLPKFV